MCPEELLFAIILCVDIDFLLLTSDCGITNNIDFARRFEKIFW